MLKLLGVLTFFWVSLLIWTWRQNIKKDGTVKKIYTGYTSIIPTPELLTPVDFNCTYVSRWDKTTKVVPIMINNSDEEIPYVAYKRNKSSWFLQNTSSDYLHIFNYYYKKCVISNIKDRFK